MDSTEKRAIEWECAQNTLRFYNRLDAVRGEEASELFAEDGTWYREGDESGWTGRAAIAAHVNRARERGRSDVPPEDRMVFHLVNNLEVTVLNSETAEVRALTAVVPGVRGATSGEAGTSQGITAVLSTLEIHKKTESGWKIASKKTARLLRVAQKT